MDAIADLISMIVFFLAWMIPLMLIFFTRRQTAGKKKTQKQHPVDTLQNVGDQKKNDSGNFIARLMNMQGIAPQSAQTPRMQASNSKNSHIQETERQKTPAAEKPIKPLQGAVSVRPIKQRKTHKSLASFESYSMRKRAIIYSEIIGKPKALSDLL